MSCRSFSNTSTNSTADYGGFYLQDQVKLRENLKMTAGVRYEIAKVITDDYYPTASHSPQRNTAWSPRAGLVYEPVKAVSLYATYAKSFQPQTGVDFEGAGFAPMYGKLLETGLRFVSPQDRYTATISAYDITKSNVLTDDPSHSNYQIAAGQQRSKGIDFDSTSKDNTYAIGHFLAGAPRHTGNFWTHYTMTHGSLQGLGAGAGIFGAGKRFGDLANDYLLPGYARVDGGFSYVRSLSEKTT